MDLVLTREGGGQKSWKSSRSHLYIASNGDYCTPLRGIIEITLTEGQIMGPEVCIMPQRDAQRI